jgi:hypothetical protein
MEAVKLFDKKKAPVDWVTERRTLFISASESLGQRNCGTEVFHARMPTMLNELIVRTEQQTPYWFASEQPVCVRGESYENSNSG